MSNIVEDRACHDEESRIALVPNQDDGSNEINEHVQVSETSSHCSTPGTRGSTWRSSKGSTVVSEKAYSTKTPSMNGSLKSRAAATLNKTGTWTYELIGLLVGASAVAGIAGVLAYFDGRAIPDWPLNITLSALIALLATTANANLAAPLQSSMSQLKWVRFKTERAPLTDMELYDEASRGTFGAVKLLTTLRGGVFGSFGAVLTIAALALGPFAQQIATYRFHVTSNPEGAAVPRAMNYTGYLPGKSSSNGFVPILPMKSAVYSGLFAENNDPTGAVRVNCASGNCTFDPFETLAICYTCTDMTPFMTRYCEDGMPNDLNFTNCGWQLPNEVAYLNKSTDVFSMTSVFPSLSGDMPYTTIMQLLFMGTESQAVPNVLNPWSMKCGLSVCIQTIDSSVVNGRLNETIISSYNNGTVVDITGKNRGAPISLTSPSTNETYFMSMGAKLAMVSWFADTFKVGSASRSAEAIN